MPARDKPTLKSYFEQGDVPTQAQFEDLIDSIPDQNPEVPISRIISAQSPLKIDGEAGADLSQNRTLSILPASASSAGSMSSTDKSKLDDISGSNTGDQTLESLSGVSHTLATAANDFLVASGVGVFVKKTLVEIISLLRTSFDAIYANIVHTHSENSLTLSDNLTNDVSNTKHGFTPKSPNDTTKFLRGDAVPVWASPTAIAVWGSITGSMASQTDLNTALTARVLKAGDTLTGSLTISSAVQYSRIGLSNGTNTIFQAFGTAANNDNGIIQLMSGGVTKVELSSTTRSLFSLLVDITHPFPKTNTSSQTDVRLRSNEPDANNPFQLSMYMVGATNLADRSYCLQTADSGLLDGGNLILQGAGGNVGIGAPDPKATLEIYKLNEAGSAPATSGATDTHMVGRFGAGSISLDIGVAGSGVTWIQNRYRGNFGGNFPIALNPNGGNVSIGTISPSGLLHIKSAANMTGIGIITEDDARRMFIGRDAIQVTTLAGAGATLYMQTTNGGDVQIGTGATGNVSAGSFTDRTPFFEGDAISELKKIKGHNGEIDHKSLPTFAKAKHKVFKPHNEKHPEFGGKEVIPDERDLGAMISMLTVAAQQLDARVSILEGV